MKTEENRTKKCGSDSKLDAIGKLKKIEVIPRCLTIHGKIPPETVGTNRQIEKITQKNEPWK